MTILKTLGLSTLALALSATFALAETYTKGTVKKLDAKAGKVTIIHEELVDLEMPAMTMVFRADEVLMAKMSEGDAIEFVADRVKGKLTVTALK
ncbi:copper-binding protein [Puniceibacterium confluentis]|uniref:copper-binding protein n=1 Tax=Puniceibacterium confluentis TaxID=1958944 RepID=UPI0011B6D869